MQETAKNSGFTEIADMLPQGIYEADEGGRLTYANRTALSFFGYTHEAIARGFNILQSIVPEDRPRVQAAMLRILQGETSRGEEYTALRSDGTIFPLTVYSSPVMVDGRVVGMRGILIDGTERKRSEEALLRSQNRYRQLFENMTAGFALHEMIYDEQGRAVDYRFLEINPAFERLTGITAVNLIGRTVKDVMPQTEQYWIDAYDAVARTGGPRAYQNYSKELKRFYDVWAFSPQRGQFATVFSDITDRKRAEDSAKLDEERLTTLLKLSQMRFSTEKELIDFALEEAVRLTRSSGGYLHFFKEEENFLQLHTWSASVLKICSAVQARHYPLSQAGIWADSVRKRGPVIHNDYQAIDGRKGYPEGHFHLSRHLGVPIFDGDRIVGVTGVGNKEEPYDDSDVRQITLFMDSMWRVLKQRRTEDEREQLITELKAALAEIKTLSGLLPICASCKKIRDDKGYWNQLESYISDHSEAEFTHGICPDCAAHIMHDFKRAIQENPESGGS